MDELQLGIPDHRVRLTGQLLAAPETLRNRRLPFGVWLLIFFAVQYIAFNAVGWLDGGAGLDPCDGTHPPGPRDVQQVVATVATISTTLLALWQLRWFKLLAALAVTALPTLLWFSLLGPLPDCGTPLHPSQLVVPLVPLMTTAAQRTRLAGHISPAAPRRRALR